MDRDEADRLLVAALIEIRQAFDKGADDWEYRLLRTFHKYLQAIGIERELIVPAMKMRIEKETEIWRARRGGKSGAKMPEGKAAAMAMAAAVVTSLKERGDCETIEAATIKVGHRAGLEASKIKVFRDNLNRHALPIATVKAYEQYVDEVRDWPTSAMLEAVADLGKFVKSGS